MANRKNPSLTLILALLCVAAFAGCHDDNSPEYNVVEQPAPSDTLTYAGSQACRTCHQAIFESWEKSRHTKKVREASLATAVNDADNNGTNDFVQGGAGIGFNVATSVPAGQTTFDDYTLSLGVEFPVLGWDGTNLLVRIGPNTYTVTYVLGGTGKWKQRYMVTIDNGEYISPVQYNDVTREYVPYHLEHWYTMTGNTLTGYLYNSATQTPVTQSKTRNSWQRRCTACHTTGLRDITVNANSEYGDNISDMLASNALSELPVACEACHGPSARHVELGGGVGTSLNPTDMAADRGNEVCGSCHTRGSSKNAEGFGYPWAEGALVDNGYQPGDVLDNFFNPTPRDGSRFWDDGAHRAKSHRQEHLEHETSAHGRAGVTCWKCHDPHGSNIDGQLRMPATELCLSCHDGDGNIDAADLSKHTRHTDPAVQERSTCHLVNTAKSAVKYDIPSHVYRVIFPTETDDSGIPNSCAVCHDDESTSELMSYLRTRFSDVKPVAYATMAPSPHGVGYELDGTRSFDPLSGPLTYEWTFKSGPPSFSADQLLARTGETAHFIPSQPGVHVFLLVVTNMNGVRSNPTEVSVDVDGGITQTAPDLTQANYVRSRACAFCHPDTHKDWEVTRHTQKVRRPGEGYGLAFVDTNNDGVNDWDQTPFSVKVDPHPDQTTWDDVDQNYAPGIEAPVLDFDGTHRTVTIGPKTYKVHWHLGGTGKWKQRYMTTIDEGEYILPIQFNEVTNEWVQYHAENWYNVNGMGGFDAYLYEPGPTETPVLLGRTADSWQRRCTACHVTGARDMTQDLTTFEWGKSIETMLAAFTGPRIADLGTGCEACHGPGSFHVDTPTLRGSIVNPAKLSALRSNEVCGACHNRGASVHSSGGKTFGFPWGVPAVDGYFIPGMDLSDFYVPKDETDSKAFWKDPYGHAKQHHEQWLDMRWSDHFTKGGLTCATCHTGHNDKISGQLTQDETSLCKSCHPSIVTDQGPDLNHSKHPNGVTECSNCHNPLVAKSAINPDVSAHSFQIIWPEASLWSDVDTAGIWNSCNTRGCHSNSIHGLRAWDYSSQADAVDDYAEHQQRLNWLFGDMRPYAEPRVVDDLPGHDGNSKRVVTGFTAAPTVVVTLDGTKSYDPNGGNVIAWQWTILSAPDTSTAKLSSRLAQKPTIEITVPGTYVFSLVVQDPQASSDPETVTVVVN